VAEARRLAKAALELRARLTPAERQALLHAAWGELRRQALAELRAGPRTVAALREALPGYAEKAVRRALFGLLARGAVVRRDAESWALPAAGAV
jgi:hypothetical protein